MSTIPQPVDPVSPEQQETQPVVPPVSQPVVPPVSQPVVAPVPQPVQPQPAYGDLQHDSGYPAYMMLRLLFTVAPILVGFDKFANMLTDWEKYLAPEIENLIPGDTARAMQMIGAVEIAAGVLVMILPMIGAYVVAGWLAAGIVSMLLLGDFYDVALRDFGLFIAALALARLATAYRRWPMRR